MRIKALQGASINDLQSMPAGQWLLAAGLWLLTAGLWLLTAGLWRLTAGLWLLTTGLWLLAVGLWRLAAGLWGLTAGFSTVNTTTARVLVLGFRVLMFLHENRAGALIYIAWQSPWGHQCPGPSGPDGYKPSNTILRQRVNIRASL